MKLRKGVLSAEVGTDLALLDSVEGSYYRLNRTGSMVVLSLLAGESLRAAASAIVRRSEGADMELVLSEARKLVLELQEAGLVVECPFE